MIDLITSEAVTALLQVVMIDLVLAGDNAVVIGLASAALPPEQRKRAIIIGIVAATALRIAFAGVATQLLQVVGLLLAGGILLLWVCWKMWRELRATSHQAREGDLVQVGYAAGGGVIAGQVDGKFVEGKIQGKTFSQAVLQIIVADVSMSLDNVLAVAGAAREHPYVLAFGLALSIGMMGAAAGLLAHWLQKYRWIAYAGLAIILYVACEMIYRGAHELRPLIATAASTFS
jgi:YjbE family integral membrane protein